MVVVKKRFTVLLHSKKKRPPRRVLNPLKPALKSSPVDHSRSVPPSSCPDETVSTRRNRAKDRRRTNSGRNGHHKRQQCQLFTTRDRHHHRQMEQVIRDKIMETLPLVSGRMKWHRMGTWTNMWRLRSKHANYLTSFNLCPIMPKIEFYRYIFLLDSV